MGKTIVVVDDEKEIADFIEMYLVNEDFEVKKFYDGTSALEYIEKYNVDLALLDVMLPDTDGFKMLKEIRENFNFPVIMLTAKTDYMDKITGLTLGADDYIPKPFNPLELVARVKAQIRRYTSYNEAYKGDTEYIEYRGLELCKDTHRAVYNGEELVLTPIEFSILWILCDNRGKVISSEQLFETIWGEKYFKNSNNTVMVHIRHIREKMHEPAGKAEFVKTIWGVGYKVE